MDYETARDKLFEAEQLIDEVAGEVDDDELIDHLFSSAAENVYKARKEMEKKHFE